MIVTYLYIGLGFYLGLAASNPKSFGTSDLSGLIRGILMGFLFWPIGIMFKIALFVYELKEKRGAK